MARGGAGLRLRQRAPLQRDASAALFGRPPGALRRPRRSRCAEAGALSVRLPYRPPYDWDAMLGVPRRARDPRRRARRRTDSYRRSIALDGDSGVIGVAPRRRRIADRRHGPLPRDGGPAADHRAHPPGVRSRAPIPARSARISRGIRRWRRWSRRGPACACRAPGTASSSRCARSSASRSRCPAATRAGRQAGRRPTASRCRRRCRRRGPDPLFPAAARIAAAGLSRALGMPRRARRGARPRWPQRGRRRSRDLRARRRPGGGDRASCARCRASANGPRNTSPCASCASPTPSPPPTSA